MVPKNDDSNSPGDAMRASNNLIDEHEAAARLERVLTNDPMMGVFRHADAGYDLARDCAHERDVRIPMGD